MPMYEYACKNCDSKFDKLVKSMRADEQVACPKCGSKKTHRALSVFAVGKGGTASSSAPTCGRCGGPPGSCAMQ